MFANNLSRDSNKRMVWRVIVLAFLRFVVAAMGRLIIFSIWLVYNPGSDMFLLACAMIGANLFVQLIIVLAQYKKKNWKVKLKEMLICIFLVRPIVDAYRISTNHKDDELTVDPLVEVFFHMVSPQVLLWMEAFRKKIGIFG